jgi:lipopolysaccharide transport system permease protein
MIDNKKWDLIITPRNRWFDFNIKEIINYKDLIFLFVKRDITTFYKQTILGPLWFFIQPFISTILFTFIFNKIANISTEGVPPYLFYMSGIIAWNYFSDCILTTSKTLTTNANIFGKVYFPRIIVPISNIISGLSKFILQFIFYIFIFLYFIYLGNSSVRLSYSAIVIIPLLIFQMALLGLGLGLIISSLSTKYRDLNYLINFGTQLLMYCSPIIYPLSIVPKEIKYIILLNPITPIIELFRQVLTGQGTFNYTLTIYSIFMSIFTFLIGIIIFNKIEKSFIDTA